MKKFQYADSIRLPKTSLLSLIFALITGAQNTQQQMPSIRCYSCTTLNADRLLSDVQDLNWKRWLENVRYVSRTEHCDDYFEPISALRSGVRSQECTNGVCLKMWFKEAQGSGQVWRSCIPNSQNKIRPDCTRIMSSQGEMEVCTCDENLCNGTKNKFSLSFTMFFALFIGFIFCIMQHIVFF